MRTADFWAAIPFLCLSENWSNLMLKSSGVRRLKRNEPFIASRIIFWMDICADYASHPMFSCALRNLRNSNTKKLKKVL